MGGEPQKKPRRSGASCGQLRACWAEENHTQPGKPATSTSGRRIGSVLGFQVTVGRIRPSSCHRPLLRVGWGMAQGDGGCVNCFWPIGWSYLSSWGPPRWRGLSFLDDVLDDWCAGGVVVAPLRHNRRRPSDHALRRAGSSGTFWTCSAAGPGTGSGSRTNRARTPGRRGGHAPAPGDPRHDPGGSHRGRLRRCAVLPGHRRKRTKDERRVADTVGDSTVLGLCQGLARRRPSVPYMVYIARPEQCNSAGNCSTF